MLRLLKRKPKPAALIEPVGHESPRRDRQKNIKVSEDCSAAFAALAEAQAMSQAALFEDLVAERMESLARQGVKLEVQSR